ncbi:hypothetical protein K7X08_027591 [Anisodus acutangulus]|uniref:Uncharacterized protein n=1 Tax=Anisodus acutangulus TaxID=402998 RepID=A0A9Q1MJN4_9SOLA|nr:hypothetical protein K7X08_027591 [Anisodus acutangulus]
MHSTSESSVVQHAQMRPKMGTYPLTNEQYDQLSPSLSLTLLYFLSAEKKKKNFLSLKKNLCSFWVSFHSSELKVGEHKNNS